MNMPKIYPMVIMAVEAYYEVYETDDEDKAINNLAVVAGKLGLSIGEAFEMYDKFDQWREKAVRDR